jgi:glucose dehydrogenase
MEAAVSSLQSRSVTRQRGAGYWAVVALGIVLILFGLPIFGGGAYLIALGGSWYYAFAGVGLLLTALYLFRGSLAAVSVYLLTYIGTVIWAFWEAGFDWWAQVPRLVAPTVILILVLATMPVLSRLSRPRRRR